MIISPIYRLVAFDSHVLIVTLWFQNFYNLVRLEPCAIQYDQVLYYSFLIILSLLYNFIDHFALLVREQNKNSLSWFWQFSPKLLVFTLVHGWKRVNLELIGQKLKGRHRTSCNFLWLMVENWHFKRELNWRKWLFTYFVHAFQTVEFRILFTKTFLSGFNFCQGLYLININVQVLKEFRWVVIKVFEGLVDFMKSCGWGLVFLSDDFFLFVCCWRLIFDLELLLVWFVFFILVIALVLEPWMHVLCGLLEFEFHSSI